MKRLSCNVCGESTTTKYGWHLKYNINLCSNKCVAKWIERTERFIEKLQGLTRKTKEADGQ